MRLRVGLLLAVCLIVGVGLWRVAQGPGEGNAGPGSGKLTESILTGPRPDAVFLIIVDTLRADRLSCYGYGGHSTPNIVSSVFNPASGVYPCRADT